MQNEELDQMLAEDDESDNVDIQLDDILNESDEKSEQNDLDEQSVRQLLLQMRISKITNRLVKNENESNRFIKKYIEQSFVETEQTLITQLIVPQICEQIPKKDSLLELIDQEEREINHVHVQEINQNFNFKLEELKSEAKQIKNIQINNLTTLSTNLNNSKQSNNKFKPQIIGQPCLIYQNPGISICIGTTVGEVVIFSATNFDYYSVLKYKSKVTALDVVTEGYLLIAGYEDSHIILWDPNSGALLKNIEGQASIAALKFYNDISMNFVVSDHSGFSNIHRVQKMLWSYSIETEKLLPRNTTPFYQITAAIKEQVIALACQEFVLVIRIEPQRSILKRISRIQPNELTSPFLSWGLNTNTEGFTETMETAMALCWGTYIEIYVLKEGNIKLISTYLLNDLIGCVWLSRDMLVAISKDFNLITLNTQFFITNPDKALQSIIPLEDKLDNPLQLQIPSGGTIPIYTNSISGDHTTTLLYLLSNPIIKRVKLLLWSEYLKILIQSADSQEGWYQILVLGLQLYWGQIFCFAIHPNQAYDQRIVIGEISKDICGTFLNLVGQQIQQSKTSEQLKYKEWEAAIVASIQYCIECNQLPFLFTGLKAQLIKFNRNTQFLNSLEPFIIKQCIKQVPMEMLNQLATHYRVLDKQSVIKQLILSLDPKQVDMSTIFSICLENDLYTPLIAVCPRIDNDFITPLQKMYSKFLRTKESKMILKCLWYIKLTFQQTLFPNEKLTYEIWALGFRQIIMWLLIDEILRQFAIEYPKELFQILRIAITDPCVSLLQTEDEQLNRYFNNQKPILGLLIIKVYDVLHLTIHTYENVGAEFSIFIGKLNLKEIVLPSEILIKSLKLLCCSKQNYYEIQNILDHYDIQQKEQLEIFNCTIIYLILASHDKQIKALFAKDIFQSIELCLKCENLDVKWFYEWINKQIKLKKQQMLKILDLYFQQIMNLDLDKFSNLLKQFTQQEQYHLMNRDSFPNYLELFIKLNPFSKQLRQLLISTLCSETPNQVLDYVCEYPLDDLESIFIKTRHLEGLGYIYNRIGRYQIAIELFSQNVLEYLEVCFNHSLIAEQYNQILLDKKFDLLFQSCLNYEQDEETPYFREVGKILFNSNTYNRLWSYSLCINESNYKQMLKLVQQINLRLSEYYGYASRQNLVGLIELFEQEKEIFGMLWLKWSFRQLFDNQQIDINLMHKVNIIYRTQFLEQKQQIYHENSSSPQYQIQCTQCQQQIDDETKIHIIVHNCGHPTHQSCLSLPYCKICKVKLQMQLDNILANNSMKQNLPITNELRREQVKKDNEQIKNIRQMEEDMNYQPTEDDLKVYAEQKLLRKMELFDYCIDQQCL